MRTPVTNNCERLIQIQVSTGINTKVPAALLTLLPGVNLVESKLWEQAKENSVARKLLVTEIERSPAPEAQLERVGQPMLVEGQPLPDDLPLKGLKLAAAQAIISETLTKSLLASWLDDESRPDVRRALEKQIAKIEGPKDAKPSSSGVVKQ
jgi:hypothetical protein